jgi:phosphoribosylanthranilate isomerase
MRVKICGLTNLNDALMCAELGAYALGFVHVRGRNRNLEIEAISDIVSSVGESVSKVLVCAPENVSEATRMFDASGTDIIQLHSLEPEDVMAMNESGIPVIRAVSTDRSVAERFAPHVHALLFEGGVPGSGKSYDYSTVPIDVCTRPIIAGGLRPDNLGPALAMNPYAVDVSSGVESSPGRKDPDLVAAFIGRCLP